MDIGERDRPVCLELGVNAVPRDEDASEVAVDDRELRSEGRVL